jgi:hypothetical protein
VKPLYPVVSLIALEVSLPVMSETAVSGHLAHRVVRDVAGDE